MSSSSPSTVSSAVPVIAAGATRSPRDVPQPARQQVLLEHDADAVEVVLGRHVEHGVVLVVEAAVLLGARRRRPRTRSLEEVPVRADMWRTGFIAMKPACCRKPGIDAPAAARIAGGHRRGAGWSRTSAAACWWRSRLTCGRVAARVDRPAHQDQAARLRLARGRHQRDRRQHRHRRLADREHVQALGADVADELADVADVVVEREGALVGRHQARVDPVGDVDLVVA